MSVMSLLENLSAHQPSQISSYARRVLYQALGPLAPSWLVPELAEAEETDPPGTERLALENGTIPLLVVQAGAQCRLLREALLLPVCWEKGTHPDNRLPVKLLDLADDILDSLCRYAEGRTETWAGSLCSDDWSLCAAVDVDLGGFEIDPKSAAVSLMAGLLVVASGGKPNPKIVATGAWKAGVGIESIGGLGPKTQLAACSPGVQMLFVPEFQQPGAEQFADEIRANGSGGPLDIKSLKTTTSDPLRALSDLLAELEMPPSDNAEFTERKDHYLRLVGWNRDGAQRYYRNRLLSEIVARCRTKVQAQTSDGSFDVLATILTRNYDLAVIAVGAFRPNRCILFFTDDTKKHLNDCREQMAPWLAKDRVQPIEIDAEADVESLAQTISDTLRPVCDQKLVIDLTPGKKTMTLAMYEAAPPAAMLYYLHNKWRGRIVEPDSENPDVWSKHNSP